VGGGCPQRRRVRRLEVSSKTAKGKKVVGGSSAVVESAVNSRKEGNQYAGFERKNRTSPRASSRGTGGKMQGAGKNRVGKIAERILQNGILWVGGDRMGAWWRENNVLLDLSFWEVLSRRVRGGVGGGGVLPSRMSGCLLLGKNRNSKGGETKPRRGQKSVSVPAGT